jgi:hypothetical protein
LKTSTTSQECATNTSLNMKKPTTKKGQQNKIATVMREYKEGKLHGGVNPKGPKKAPIVKSRRQAVAIALRSAGVKKK